MNGNDGALMKQKFAIKLLVEFLFSNYFLYQGKIKLEFVGFQVKENVSLFPHTDKRSKEIIFFVLFNF